MVWWTAGESNPGICAMIAKASGRPKCRRACIPAAVLMLCLAAFAAIIAAGSPSLGSDPIYHH